MRSPPCLSVAVPEASIPQGYAEGEASIIINPLQRTAHSAGFVVVPCSAGCGPPLTGGVMPSSLRIDHNE